MPPKALPRKAWGERSEDLSAAGPRVSNGIFQAAKKSDMKEISCEGNFMLADAEGAVKGGTAKNFGALCAPKKS